MEGYVEKVNEVTVPRNTGVDGFLKTIRGILGLKNVQNVSIDAKGVVRYTRYMRDGEADSPLQMDYTGLEPWSIIRERDLEDVGIHATTPAPATIAVMFNFIARENLVPVAFVTGARSMFWDWHERTSGVVLSRFNNAYGLPIYTDRQVPDHRLILCASYQRSGLLDCHRFLLTSMEESELEPPQTSVSIL